MEIILSAENIYKIYNSASGPVHALNESMYLLKKVFFTQLSDAAVPANPRFFIY